MDNTAFDAFTRGLSRQQAFSAPITAEDRNRKKKNNGRDQKKVFARCSGQVPACEAFVQNLCGANTDCLALVSPCCERLNTCDFTGFVTCFDDAVIP